MSNKPTGVKTNIELTSKDFHEKLHRLFLNIWQSDNGWDDSGDGMWMYYNIFATKEEATESGVVVLSEAWGKFHMLGTIKEYAIIGVNGETLITTCRIEHKRYDVDGEPVYYHNVKDHVLENVLTPFFLSL